MLQIFDLEAPLEPADRFDCCPCYTGFGQMKTWKRDIKLMLSSQNGYCQDRTMRHCFVNSYRERCGFDYVKVQCCFLMHECTSEYPVRLDYGESNQYGESKAIICNRPGLLTLEQRWQNARRHLLHPCYAGCRSNLEAQLEGSSINSCLAEDDSNNSADNDTRI